MHTQWMQVCKNWMCKIQVYALCGSCMTLQKVIFLWLYIPYLRRSAEISNTSGTLLSMCGSTGSSRNSKGYIIISSSDEGIGICSTTKWYCGICNSCVTNISGISNNTELVVGSNISCGCNMNNKCGWSSGCWW